VTNGAGVSRVTCSGGHMLEAGGAKGASCILRVLLRYMPHHPAVGALRKWPRLAPICSSGSLISVHCSLP